MTAKIVKPAPKITENKPVFNKDQYGNLVLKEGSGTTTGTHTTSGKVREQPYNKTSSTPVTSGISPQATITIQSTGQVIGEQPQAPTPTPSQVPKYTSLVQRQPEQPMSMRNDTIRERQPTPIQTTSAYSPTPGGIIHAAPSKTERFKQTIKGLPKAFAGGFFQTESTREELRQSQGTGKETLGSKFRQGAIIGGLILGTATPIGKETAATKGATITKNVIQKAIIARQEAKTAAAAKKAFTAFTGSKAEKLIQSPIGTYTKGAITGYGIYEGTKAGASFIIIN